MNHDIRIPGFPISVEQEIEVRGRTTMSTVQLTLRILSENDKGVIIPTQHVFNWTNTQGLQQNRFPVGEGRLLSLSLTATSQVPEHGFVFALVGLKRDIAGSTDIFTCLCSGQLSADYPLAWPSSNLRSPTDGQGGIAIDTISNPGAGTNFSWSVPAHLRVKPMGLVFSFATDATVANRVVGVAFKISGVVVFFSNAEYDQPANKGVTYHFGLNTYEFGVLFSSRAVVRLPEAYLRSGDTIVTLIFRLQGGDSITSISHMYEYWFNATSLTA